MESKPRTVRIYRTADDSEPFSEWLESLRDDKAIAVIKKRLVRVALGNLGTYRFVGDGVFEFKIDYGPGYRVYFVQIGKVAKRRILSKLNNIGLILKIVKTSTSRSYHEYLIESLQNPRSAAAYLETFLEDGTEEEILLALGHVAEAQMMAIDRSQDAPQAELMTPTSLTLISFSTVLDDLGLKLSITPKEQAA
jgi:putative addiction module killer protein